MSERARMLRVIAAALVLSVIVYFAAVQSMALGLAALTWVLTLCFGMLVDLVQGRS